MEQEYYSITQYVDAKSKLIGKVATYDLLIESMEKAILLGTESGHINQYEMDDGQMKVRANYRSISEMVRAVKGLETLRQMYINRINGSITVLRGGNHIN